MDINIPCPLQFTQEHIITESETALLVGSGGMKVYASPSMIAFMENTAYKMIQEKLPPGYTSVGIRIEADHTRALLPGTKIVCKACLEKIEGKILHFLLTVNAGDCEIGKAVHLRALVEEERFLSKLHKQ